MINSLRIRGFKSIVDQNFKLGKLTVLTGLNNSGKSSVIQAIRTLYQVRRTDNPYLDGFGGYSELRSIMSESGSPTEIVAAKNKFKKCQLLLNPEEHFFSGNYPLPVLQYISADRYGPRVSLPLMTDDAAEIGVGSLGQYCAHYARMFGDTIVSQKLRHTQSKSNTLEHQLVKWMGEIAPGIKLEFDVAKKYDSSSMTVDDVRATNSGYGISYALSIVLAILNLTGKAGASASEKQKIWFENIRENGAILIVENPEAHLHPRGQTNIGKLLAIACSAGLQVVLETHSDHLLDGIRLGIKDENAIAHRKLKGSDVGIFFLTKTEEGVTESESIVLLDNGRIQRWPRGFFDQFSINLRALG